jgi:glycosyltransferase involved in cell wall biosynthesis
LFKHPGLKNFLKKVLIVPRKIRVLLPEYSKSLSEALSYKRLHVKAVPQKILILDDCFPNLYSGFRIAEFNALLKYFPECEIITTTPCYWQFKKNYLKRYPENKNRFFRSSSYVDYSAAAAYVLFINNAIDFLPLLERYRTPFAVGLYPGGGLNLGDNECDEKLHKIFSSPYFRKVLVDEINILSYLVDKKFCPREKIEYTYGNMSLIDYYRANLRKKYKYKEDKDTFDICFVAHKNSDAKQGKAKGYDVFIKTAKILAGIYPDIRFHVVGGGHDESAADIRELGDKISFYGTRSTEYFFDFYSKMDIILSPTRPSVLAKGSFDGFPTGACIEAASCGVAIFSSDILNLNTYYELGQKKFYFNDGGDMIIINLEPKKICEKIGYYYKNYDKLYRLSENGKNSIHRLFGYEAQMPVRIKILKEIILNG